LQILIIIGIILAVLIAYLVLRKKPEPELDAAPEPQKLPEKRAPKAEAKEDKRPSTPSAKPKETAKADKKAKPREAEPSEPPVDEEEPEEPSEKPAARPEPLAKRKPDVEGLRKGLAKARQREGFFGRLKALFVGRKEIDPGIVEEMEEVLLTSDVGVKTTEALLAHIREALEKNELTDPDKVWEALRKRAEELLSIGTGGLALSDKPTVVMVVGVNGAGKTTTIGKLATKLKAQGRTVVLAAGDTFRAAAVKQLELWGERVGCEVVKGKDGANPGSVIFDAIKRAEEVGADVVLADTAGRLHTKTNLMDELTKVSRTMSKAKDGAPHETLLVLDATNGQNAMQQAAMFKEALPLSGIVLTKLDGTAKGGVILGVCAEHALPVRYIGVGESAEDLKDFIADEFVEALLGGSAESADEAA
jgi:fused signal recognition particle receptor